MKLGDLREVARLGNMGQGGLRVPYDQSEETRKTWTEKWA